MASTIILKHGTGSAVATSLQQGEFAINVDSGSLYYGVKGGGTVSSSFNIANLTASGNISSSDTITALSGSFSNLSVSSFGQITASGDISSSGTIIGLSGSFSQTIITLKAGANDSPFIITIADTNGQDNKLEVNKDGVLKMGALDDLPTAVTGGLVYSSSAFYMGH